MGDNGIQRPAEKARSRPLSQPRPQSQPGSTEMPLSWQFPPNSNCMLNSPFIGLKRRRRPMPSAVISTKRESRWLTSGCSAPQSREPKQQKFELPKPTKKGLKIPQYGPSIAKFEIGKRRRVANRLREDGLRHSSSNLSFSIILSCCLFHLRCYNIINWHSQSSWLQEKLSLPPLMSSTPRGSLAGPRNLANRKTISTIEYSRYSICCSFIDGGCYLIWCFPWSSIWRREHRLVAKIKWRCQSSPTFVTKGWWE